MKLSRRHFLQAAASTVPFAALPGAAIAESYPSRPARILVGYAAGGVNDIIARLTGQLLSERLSQSFVVEDRPGAGSNIATEAVVRAGPDGYTLLEASSSNAWNATIYQHLNFDFIRDIAPVASTVRTYNVMEVNPAVPAKTIPEFIAYAKANPGKINMASAGEGSSPHLYGEMFKAMTGVDLLTVQYRGSGAALPDLLAGQCQVMFDSVVSSIAHIRAGRLRVLGVTSATRVDLLPGVPAIAEFVPGYEGIGWQGIGAPKDTPADVIAKLNQQINAGFAGDAKLKSRLNDLGAVTSLGTPAEFGKFVAGYTAKWAPIIRSANVKAE